MKRDTLNIVIAVVVAVVGAVTTVYSDEKWAMALSAAVTAAATAIGSYTVHKKIKNGKAAKKFSGTPAARKKDDLPTNNKDKE